MGNRNTAFRKQKCQGHNGDIDLELYTIQWLTLAKTVMKMP